MASAYGASPIAELLLKKEADPDVQDHMGLTPLHMAAGYVRPTTAKMLIENGAVSVRASEKGLGRMGAGLGG